MALREITEDGAVYQVTELPRATDFYRIWNTRFTAAERDSIRGAVNQRLDELITSPDPNWGSITNTSIEGGRRSPATGQLGDWTGTPFEAIYRACGCSHDYAGMFFGNVWKMIIIERPELWVGIRYDPTFPVRGITLNGKTYFLDQSSRR